MGDAALERFDVALVRADNPGPYTLSGTNTWVVGRDPAYVVDPGPAAPAHIAAVAAEVARRGGLGGIALTHDHPDHAEGVEALRAAAGAGAPESDALPEDVASSEGREPASGRRRARAAVPVAAARGDVEVLGDGDRFGPLVAVPTPGHSEDHLAFVAGPVCFSGDAVLGEGSVFVTADLGAYLAALRRLRALDLALICPGHGPPVTDPAAKLEQYVDHRLERERRLLDALRRGLRSEDELLDAVWDDAPAPLRFAAAMTLRAHLEKLREEGRWDG